MIIVTGSVRARSDRIDELLHVSLEHVHRSTVLGVDLATDALPL